MGEALGICAGDIGYFLAYEILSETVVDGRLKTKVMSLFSRELTQVAVAQMRDVRRGAENTTVSIDEILRLYTYKTARYTFSLPLMAGAIVANRDHGDISLLEAVGTSLGVLFQIKDDELGILGNAEILGKPIDSDIREGKKTLYYHFLMTDPENRQLERTRAIYGNDEIDEGDLSFIRERIKKLDIQAKIDDISRQLTSKATADIAALQADSKAKQILVGLLDYNAHRMK
jgi:geranylgeranyl diphosphate synthase type I